MLGFENDRDKPRFPALRIVARTYEFMAIVILAIALVMLLVFLVTIIGDPSKFLVALLGAGFTAWWSFIAAVTMLFIAQFIRLALAIEQNTRETQVACRRLAEHLCAVESEA